MPYPHHGGPYLHHGVHHPSMSVPLGMSMPVDVGGGVGGMPMAFPPRPVEPWTSSYLGYYSTGAE